VWKSLHRLRDGFPCRLAASLVGDFGDYALEVDGLYLTGSLIHRPYLWGLYEGRGEPYMAHLFRESLRPGMTVCDLRSYIGYYGLMAGRIVGAHGKVFAFEPDPHNFAYLLRKIQANACAGAVVPFQTAVTRERGRAPFFIGKGDRSRSSLYWKKVGIHRIPVDTVCLDEFFGDPGARVDVVKMDIEGAELHALRGMERVLARSPNVTLFVECNPPALRTSPASPHQLVDALQRLGFPPRIIDEGARQSLPVTPDIEKVDSINLLCRKGNPPS
jgi:FkbM family methyltransferase